MTMKFTLQKLRRQPLRLAQRLRQRGVRGTLAWFAYQAAWRRRERQLGINTAEHAYGLDVYGVGEGQYYDPIDHRCCDIILDYLSPDPHRDVFLDYGCGLGRAVILAALRPFRRVVGVEINEQLVDLCQKHVAAAQTRGKLQCPIEIVHQDAAQYKVPHDVNCILMYNTFIGENLMGAVLEQIRRSLAESPRELTIVFAPLLRHANLLENCPWLERRFELPTAFWDHVRVLVYETKEL